LESDNNILGGITDWSLPAAELLTPFNVAAIADSMKIMQSVCPSSTLAAPDYEPEFANKRLKITDCGTSNAEFRPTFEIPHGVQGLN
jgi:hypothetical protein